MDRRGRGKVIVMAKSSKGARTPAEDLITVVEEAAKRGKTELVMIDNAASFEIALSELLHAAVPRIVEAVIIADSTTAHETIGDRTLVAAKGAYIFGRMRSLEKEKHKHLKLLPAIKRGRKTGERFCIILSPNLSVGIVGLQSRPPGRPSGIHTFRGVLTVDHKIARATARTALSAAGCKPRLPGSAATATPQKVESSLILMNRIAERVMADRTSAEARQDDLFLVLDIVKSISTLRRTHDVLYVFAEKIAQVISVARCSVLRAWQDEETGHVIVSHEDPAVHNIMISLDKYPEVTKAIATNSCIVVNDIFRDPMMADVRDNLVDAGLRSLIVVPITLRHEAAGTLLLRAARHEAGFSRREVQFCEIVANAAGSAIERAHLFESIQAANDKLERLAITDELTGLYNNRYFKNRLRAEFQRAERYGSGLSCLIIDTDNFQFVNDTYGHLTGDLVLRELAHGMQARVRKTDTLARYGGEEFVLIMPQTGEPGAIAQAERLRDTVSKIRYAGLPRSFRITVSVGVATYSRDRMEAHDDLLRCADVALAEAKNCGKNKVVVYRKSMSHG